METPLQHLRHQRPLIQDVTKSKYILVAAWVTSGHPKRGFIVPKRLQTGGELKRDLKQREVVLPLCRPLSTRDATEVYHALEGILRDIEVLTSETLYPAVPGTWRVTRRHSDCASEFTGRVAELFALGHGLVSTWTGSHSPQSNGRAERLARRHLVGSHLPIDLWSFAVQHAVESPRVKRLRSEGDVSFAECWLFGAYAAMRVLGAVKSFGPFEERGFSVAPVAANE
eukprot:4811269-Amphidinium_carterae.1